MQFTTRAWVWKSRISQRWLVSTRHKDHWEFPTWEQAMRAANIAVSIPDSIWKNHAELLDPIIHAEMSHKYVLLLAELDEEHN